MKSFSGTVQVLPLIIDDVNVKPFRVRQKMFVSSLTFISFYCLLIQMVWTKICQSVE